MHTLRITGDVFEETLRQLASRPNGRLTLAAGLSTAGVDREWLVAQRLVLGFDHSLTQPVTLHLARDSDQLVQLLELETLRLLRQAEISADEPARALSIAIGADRAAGQLGGVVLWDRSVEGLSAVQVVSPGWPCVAGASPPSARMTEAAETWARSIGALGAEAFHSLGSLSAALVGVGRSGILMATSLVQLGLSRMLLVDSDRIEPHNLGEMDLLPETIGRLKAEAIAEYLEPLAWKRAGRPCVLEPVASSVLTLEGLRALKQADFIVSCPDNGAARLAVAIVGALYLKPVLDIGVGVFRDQVDASANAGPRIGADVRWVLPGSCLYCFGGVAGAAEAARELLENPTGGLTSSDAGLARRAGSLRSLNQIAVGHGVRMLEEFTLGRLRQAWLQLDFDDSGLPSTQVVEQTPPTACPICAFRGAGDAGLGLARAALEQIHASADSSPSGAGSDS